MNYHLISWTGDKAVKELQSAGITQQCFPILQECATKVHHNLTYIFSIFPLFHYNMYTIMNYNKFLLILFLFTKQAVKAAADSESNGAYLSGISVATLEGTMTLFQFS
jgi:hypothetical protein